MQILSLAMLNVYQAIFWQFAYPTFKWISKSLARNV
jgi:hypothetical protein